MVSEIITLQLGDYANRVGAHFWNLQDEAIACCEREAWKDVASTIDSEVLCSWTNNDGCPTYSPRCVVVDHKGCLGGVMFLDPAMMQEEGLSVPSWDGHVDMHDTAKISASQYRRHLEAARDNNTGGDTEQQQETATAAQALHGSPDFWTDYLQVDFQPSCVLTLPQTWGNVGDRDGWGSAADSSNSKEIAESAVDRVRWWAEQCDRLQGLQVMADDLGGWGSFGANAVLELREQYPGLPLLYYSLQKQQAGITDSSKARQSLSQYISVAEIPQLVSMYVPLSPPVSSPGGSDGASLLAAAIDTTTLPFRCTGTRTAAGAVLGAMDMRSTEQLLTSRGANLAAVSLQLPVTQTCDLSCRSFTSGSGHRLLTPGVKLTADNCIAESITLRGLRSGAALANTGEGRSLLEDCIHKQRESSCLLPGHVHTCISPMPLALPMFFPDARERSSVTALGSTTIAQHSGSIQPCSADAVMPGAMSRWSGTFSFRDQLRQTLSKAQSLTVSALGRSCLDQWGYSASDAEELRECVESLAEKYEENV